MTGEVTTSIIANGKAKCMLIKCPECDGQNRDWALMDVMTGVVRCDNTECKAMILWEDAEVSDD